MGEWAKTTVVAYSLPRPIRLLTHSPLAKRSSGKRRQLILSLRWLASAFVVVIRQRVALSSPPY